MFTVELGQFPSVPYNTLWTWLQSAEAVDDENPVRTGPYLYQTHDQDRQVWVRNDDWWGVDQLGIELAPRYIIDVVNPSNSVALGRVLQGGVDPSNNFLPGVASLVDGGYDVATYYAEPPYMLSANTAWLVPNTAQPPLNDPAFRRALAFSIDTNRIVEDVYGNIVQAANPTGLLPNWDKYVENKMKPEEFAQVVEEEGNKILTSK